MNDAIDIRNLSKDYGAINALTDVSISVAPGELFGIIGPDGAGKSTLYKILATLLSPDSGTARIFGHDTISEFSRIRTLVGYMPERFSLYHDLTVKENLRFFASLFGVSVTQNFDLIAPIFSQLARFPNRRAGALSGGMKQKLALSCALIHSPRLLLLDEPTTGVDAVSRNEFWDMLSALREKGITILVSTSYMDEATRCERIAMINRGHILATDTPEGLIRSFDQPLYAATAPGNMFVLLQRLREMPEVADCYTFGASIHIVGSTSFSPEAVCARLVADGLPNVIITPTRPTIEDLFLRYSNEN